MSKSTATRQLSETDLFNLKAMTREEAIACIRDFMGQLTEGCQEAIMTAIPELREHSQPRDYAITFWTYLDENRPEGKMCLSNGECADIEKAFIEHDWAKILRYAKKYLSPKEFIEGDKIIERTVGMHGEPIEIALDKYAQRARGIFPGDELTIILRTKR